jgi:hypothetical protein
MWESYNEENYGSGRSTELGMLRKIRPAMKDRDCDSNYMLSGVVEMNDAYFGAPQVLLSD